MSIWFTTICLANKHLHIQDLTYCSACLLIESIIGPTIPSCSFQRSRSKQFVISGRREQIPKIPYLPKNLKKLPVFSCVYVFFPNIRRRGYTSLPTWALPRHRPPTSFALDAKEMAKDLADVPGSSLSWLQLASRTMTFNGCVFQRGKKQSEMKPMGSSHQIESNRGFHLYIPFDPFWERLQLETCSGMPIGPSLGLSLIWRETPKYTCSSFTIWCLVIFRNEMGNIYIPHHLVIFTALTNQNGWCSFICKDSHLPAQDRDPACIADLIMASCAWLKMSAERNIILRFGFCT